MFWKNTQPSDEDLKREKAIQHLSVYSSDKPERREVDDVNVDYTGFQVPDEFVVGYGLDYDQLYRNLPYVGVVETE